VSGLATRARNTLTGLAALLALADPAQRRLWGEMRAYVRGLPAELNKPLHRGEFPPRPVRRLR
jgi:hypothetical protein